jgi:AI-2 transport protein TqsA
MYNGVTFNLDTLLTGFYSVASGVVPVFFIVWALSNLAGPLVLGRLFDTVGRKPMISLSYLGSAVVAVVLAGVFVTQVGGAWGFLAVLAVCFFLASAGDSSARPRRRPVSQAIPASPPPASTSARLVVTGREFASATDECHSRFPPVRRADVKRYSPMRFEPAESSETPSWGLPRALVVLIGLAAGVIAVAGIKAFSSVIGPAFLALMLTVAIHPLHKWLHRKGVPAWLCVVATLSVVFGILLGLVAALVLSIARFATILPAYQEKFDDLVQQARQLLEARGVGSGEVEKALNIDANRVFSIVTAILDRTLGVFSGVLFIVALLLFMATDAITYERRLEILQRMRPDIASALTTFSVGIKKYLLVSTVFGLIVAALDAGALWLIGIPLPILWGLLSFITNYIPNIGFILGLIPPALLGLLEGGPGTLLLVIVVYGVLNFVVVGLPGG